MRDTGALANKSIASCYLSSLIITDDPEVKSKHFKMSKYRIEYVIIDYLLSRALNCDF